jgi:hypothetical protein
VSGAWSWQSLLFHLCLVTAVAVASYALELRVLYNVFVVGRVSMAGRMMPVSGYQPKLNTAAAMGTTTPPSTVLVASGSVVGRGLFDHGDEDFPIELEYHKAACVRVYPAPDLMHTIAYAIEGAEVQLPVREPGASVTFFAPDFGGGWDTRTAEGLVVRGGSGRLVHRGPKVRS